jgi:acetoin utilization deacetylase AcuC-like enzyme
MLLITSPRFEEHVTPPGHPERMERAHVFNAVAARWLERGGRTAAPRAVTAEELARVHDPAYLGKLACTAGRAVQLDADTYTSPESMEIAALAAGAAVQAVEHALDHAEPAFALVRPPGHHAERDRAMGFCLYNNAAVAAAAARARGLERVAVVDIDVHHGNGTQWMFYGDPSVLYVSAHQFPFYPGTGAADERGTGGGVGFTVNVPLEAGCGDEDYALVYRAIVGPVLEQFAPALIVVSAGFDAHDSDPLASMRMSTAGYAALARSLAATAAARGSALALVTEGGYDLPALAACLDASLQAIDGAPFTGGPATVDSAAVPPRRGDRAVADVRRALAPYWRL